jgi:hypothetical protein
MALIGMDGCRRIGEQHHTMVTLPSRKSTGAIGNRVPIMVNAQKSNSGAAAVAYVEFIVC